MLRAWNAPQELADELVDAELWELAEGGYQFHDWNDYNPLAADVLAARKADAERKARGRAAGAVAVSKQSPAGLPADVARIPTCPDPDPDPKKNSHTRVSAGAREEQEPRQSDKRIGNDFMLQATTLHWQEYDSELCLIGMKPEAERLRALAAIQADPWCQANNSNCSPKHVLRKWNSYSRGLTGLQAVGDDGEAAERAAARQRAERYATDGRRLKAELAQLKPLVDVDPDARAKAFVLENQLSETLDLFNRAKRASAG